MWFDVAVYLFDFTFTSSVSNFTNKTVFLENSYYNNVSKNSSRVEFLYICIGCYIIALYFFEVSFSCQVTNGSLFSILFCESFLSVFLLTNVCRPLVFFLFVPFSLYLLLQCKSIVIRAQVVLYIWYVSSIVLRGTILSFFLSVDFCHDE